MKYLILLVLLPLAGCSATNFVRVTEYDGAAVPIPGVNAAAGGCMGSFEGNVPDGVRLEYKGQTCTMVVETPKNAEGE